MVFQAAHYNPMGGHLGYDKTLNRIIGSIAWGFGRMCAGAAHPAPSANW